MLTNARLANIKQTSKNDIYTVSSGSHVDLRLHRNQLVLACSTRFKTRSDKEEIFPE